MKTDIYCLAGRNIKITTTYPEVHELYREYRTEKDPEKEFSTGPEEIRYERDRLRRLFGEKADNMPDVELENAAVLRKIARWFAGLDTLTFHASAVSLDGNGYLFTATSGTGKSTQARLWRETFGDRAVSINDDRPFIRVGENGAEVYGSPWDGKHHLSRNEHVPIRGIAVLKRGEQNSIRPLPAEEAWPKMFQQTYRPETGEGTTHVLDLLQKLMKTVPIWELTCNMDPEAVRVAYAAMSGKAE